LKQFMNIELPSGKPGQEQRSLNECFADKPHLRRRLLEISDMIDTLVAQGSTAHEAEAKAIEQIRKLGNGILTEWAEKSEAAAVAKAQAKDPQLRPYRKKKP
jgi:hypothetical protein